MSNNSKYAEILPEKCPPDQAAPLESCKVIRLLRDIVPTKGDFASHAALGKPIPPARGDKLPPDPCSWASCSTQLAGPNPVYKARGLARLPKFRRFNYAAIMKVGPHSGKALINVETAHVDYWFYGSFDPLLAVESVEPLR